MEKKNKHFGKEASFPFRLKGENRMYQIMNISSWNRKKQFKWFNSFANPCYGINIDLDVTEIVSYSKKTKTSFFINFLYIIMRSLNSVEELRLRIVGDEVRLYDVIHPTYTVMTEAGIFENCKDTMETSYKQFYQSCHKTIEEAKHQTEVKEEYNDAEQYDVYYLTCLPRLDYTAMTHPLPDYNKESSSVPRICFGKYNKKENNTYTLSFNLTVSHALVDGYPCCRALNLLKENCKNCLEFFEV